MSNYVEAECRCGAVGCGGRMKIRIRNCAYPSQFKSRICPACHARGCRGHYDKSGVNIPARSCPARQAYEARKLGKALAAA